MKLLVDFNYQDCDPGNSSSAESSDGNSSVPYVTNNINNTCTNATMSSNRVSRGTSEPPVDYHGRTGLRQSGCPFKVSGIVMGSQENLASSDDEKTTSNQDPYSIFGRRLRRSITPVRITPKKVVTNSTLPRSNNTSDLQNATTDPDFLFSTPFGTTQNCNAMGKQALKAGRKQELGHWGQPRYAQETGTSDENNIGETQIVNQTETSRIENELMSSSSVVESTKSSVQESSIVQQDISSSSSISVEETIFVENNKSETHFTSEKINETANESKINTMNEVPEFKSEMTYKILNRSSEQLNSSELNSSQNVMNVYCDVTKTEDINVFNSNVVENRINNEPITFIERQHSENNQSKQWYSESECINTTNQLRKDSSVVEAKSSYSSNDNNASVTSIYNTTTEANSFVQDTREESWNCDIFMTPDDLPGITPLSKDSTLNCPTHTMSYTNIKEDNNNSERECINTTNQLKLDSSLNEAKSSYCSNDNNASVNSLYNTTTETNSYGQDTKEESKNCNRLMTSDDLPGITSLSKDSTLNRPTHSMSNTNIKEDNINSEREYINTCTTNQLKLDSSLIEEKSSFSSNDNIASVKSFCNSTTKANSFLHDMRYKSKSCNRFTTPYGLPGTTSLSKDSTLNCPTHIMSNTNIKEDNTNSERECINTTNQLKLESSLIEEKSSYSSNDNNASVKSIYNTTTETNSYVQDTKEESKNCNRLMTSDDLPGITSLSKDSTLNRPTHIMSKTNIKDDNINSERECINTTNQLNLDSSLIEAKSSYRSNDNNASVKPIYNTTTESNSYVQDTREKSKNCNRFMTPDDLPGLTSLSKDSTLSRPTHSMSNTNIKEDATYLESVSSICVEETIILKRPAQKSIYQQPLLESRPDTACTSITIGSDVLEVDPEDVRYHEGCTDIEDDFYDELLEVQAHEVSYHGPKKLSRPAFHEKRKTYSNESTRDSTTSSNEFTLENSNFSYMNINNNSNTTKQEIADSTNAEKTFTESHMNKILDCSYSNINCHASKSEDSNKSDKDTKENVKKKVNTLRKEIMESMSKDKHCSQSHMHETFGYSYLKEGSHAPKKEEDSNDKFHQCKHETNYDDKKTLTDTVFNNITESKCKVSKEIKVCQSEEKIFTNSFIAETINQNNAEKDRQKNKMVEQTHFNESEATEVNHKSAISGIDQNPMIKEDNSKSNISDKNSEVDTTASQNSIFLTELKESSEHQNKHEKSQSAITVVEENSENHIQTNFVMCKKEYVEMEKLFDKLIENDGLQFNDFQELLKSQSEDSSNMQQPEPEIVRKLENSRTEDSISSLLRSSSTCNAADESVLNDGDISSADENDNDTICTSDTSNSLKSTSTKVKRKKSSKSNANTTTQDESDAEDSSATVISDIKRKTSEGKRKGRERRKSLVIPPSTINEKHRVKRRRNRTIDNPEAWCSTIATYTLKTYTKEELTSDVVRAPHTKEETGCQTQPQTDNESGTEEGLGQGFGIIINKLKNIETKLDELKTIDHIDGGNNLQNTLIYEDDLPLGIEASGTCGSSLLPQSSITLSQLEYSQLPEVGISPTCILQKRDASTLSLDFMLQEERSPEKQLQENNPDSSSVSTNATDNESSSSMIHYVYTDKEEENATSISNIDNDFKIEKEQSKENHEDKEDSDDDNTLIVDDDNLAEHHDEYVTELPNDEYDDRRKHKSTPENVVIQSPSPDYPSRNNMRKDTHDTNGSRPINNTFTGHKSHTLDIVSVPPSDMSDFDDDDLLEDDIETRASSRASRIEELANKMMEEIEMKKDKVTSNRTRHPSDPGVKNIMDILGELDTVSERSEVEEEGTINDDSEDSGSLSDSSQKTQASYEKFCKKKDRLREQQKELEHREASIRDSRGSSTQNTNRCERLRTRSASRDRTLGKIKYCWRCHHAGHESYECTVQLNPAAWCPRCLESSHWEDSCWLTDKEVFCNICTLPGHLPCVHQTNDFRQRKLVIETFGWLAFKDWFREPEFWSWWNCAGFTNVPLYKLMQHRPNVASPDFQENSES